MKTINFLNPGDTIGVCAPSGNFDEVNFSKGINIIKDLGFNVFIPEGLEQKKRYLAGNDNHRADILTQLFSNDSIKAIICARGGFGALRILDFLDWEIIKNSRKFFIGFSDNTALLNVLSHQTKAITIHGPTVVSLATASQITLNSFYNSLTSIPEDISSKNGLTIFKGKAKGQFLGGNIATLCHMIGTKYQPDFNNAILFLEDIAEPAYKIDRMLTHMKMAGMFEKISGVVTGSFEKCDNIEMIHDILSEIFYENNIPVFSGLDAGHGGVNLSMHMGCMVELDAIQHRISWKKHP